MFYIGTNHLGYILDTPPKTIELIKTVDCVIIEFENMFLDQLKELGLDTPNYILFRNGQDFIDEVIDMLKDGQDVLLLDEMGCPGVADPGSDLISAIIEHNFPMETVVGPSIPSLAVASSGYKSRGFVAMETFDMPDLEVQDYLLEVKNLRHIIVLLDFKENVLNIAKMANEILYDRSMCLCINIGWPGYQKVIKKEIKEMITFLENSTMEDLYGPENNRPVVTIVFSNNPN